ncbi:MAG: galactose-1-phosphate uridylyltransferase [Candidatus Moranbacteria bacterium]|nr:galactose-1-phosphate uridylyltransferase [Candidatus Moranbacteria bacterium]
MEEKIKIAHKKIDSGQSELRYNVLRDEWVIIAKNRGKRPHQFKTEEKKVEYDEKTDVFYDLEKSGQEKDTLIYSDDNGEWTTRVFPNKFPVVKSGEELKDVSENFYPALTATGNHEIVLTRDGKRTFSLLDIYELAEVIDAYRERYISLMRKKDIKSVTIFHNHGKKAGASVIHPHSQIIALPVVTSAVMREIEASEKYYKSTKRNLFELIVEYELKKGERVIYENEEFLAYCPFASDRAFQIRIMPKKPQPYFERINTEQERSLAEVLSVSLRTLYNGLEDPDFNYYIHTAPCDGKAYPNYNFHIDIFPRTHLYAGFEFATDIEIVPISPEDAAKFLRDSL